jgi:two-component system nitrogen regulation response regulator NtrX
MAYFGQRNRAMGTRILVIDDDVEVLESLKGLLTDEGYEVITAASGDEGLKRLKEEPVELVLLDIIMPGKSGLDVLAELGSHPPAIAISAFADVETAVRAVKSGAYDFVEKPFMGGEKLLVTIENALAFERLRRENEDYRKHVALRYEIIGRSTAIKVLKEEIGRAAPTQGRVMILGENGTGKELVARNLHNLSLRSQKPFVEINCAAIPSELIESELFGYEKGAFTGATGSRKGKFELADGGTLFLDEICDMPLQAQAKLLRVLQEGEFRRIGGNRLIQVDVRIVTATNKNIEEEVEKDRLRQDLYYRLNVIPIVVPPLRARKEDIPILSEYFLRLFCSENGRAEKKLTGEARNVLLLYPWPGNVRELKNCMERLVIMTEETLLHASVVRKQLSLFRRETLDGTLTGKPLRERIKAFEKMVLEEELEKTNWNISRAARNLGIERPNLHRKIREYRLRREERQDVSN